jgi:hypothetical protein
MPSKNVKVRAFIDPAGNVDFDVDGVSAKHSRLKLPKDSGKHDITFMLHDQTDRGLRFDTGDPIWVDEDGPCPPSPGVSSDQLNIGDCMPDRLSAINANDGRPRELRYQLNFIGGDGKRETCDPIIENGGGTGGNL